MTHEERISAFNANMTDRGMIDRDAPAFTRRHGGNKWLVGDYEAGDVVFHNACMIHASGTNRDKNGRIRLATDLRFADKSKPYDTRWAENYWRPGDGL